MVNKRNNYFSFQLIKLYKKKKKKKTVTYDVGNPGHEILISLFLLIEVF